MSDPAQPLADVVPQEVVVHQGGRLYRLAYRPGETLLETMWRGGVRAPFLCEQGVCGTCMVRRLSGEVTLRENHVLSDTDLKQGYTLACQGVPSGPLCEIEIEG